MYGFQMIDCVERIFHIVNLKLESNTLPFPAEKKFLHKRVFAL